MNGSKGMYGPAPIDFRISGKVTDVASSPIKDIVVTYDKEHSARTNSAGLYEIILGYSYEPGLANVPTSFTVTAKDTDIGANGGLFKSQTETAERSGYEEHVEINFTLELDEQ
jgi:hypothetical protein